MLEIQMRMCYNTRNMALYRHLEVFMTVLAAILMALVAGVTEIYPLSGSGHLYILAKLLGVSTQGAVFQSFRAMLCFGVAFAGVLYYRTQLFDVARESLVLLGLLRPTGGRRGEPFGRRLGLLLLPALLPMLPALLLNGLRQRLEQGDFTLAIIGGLLCVSGTVLFFSARSARGKRSIHQMTLSDALAAGLAQVFSVFPGLSRTGLTAAVLLSRGLEGAAVAEFTGLMGIPVFLGAGILQLSAAVQSGKPLAGAAYLILGFSLSALTGFFTLRFFTELISRRRPTGFAYETWGAAILALILFLISA